MERSFQIKDVLQTTVIDHCSEHLITKGQSEAGIRQSQRPVSAPLLSPLKSASTDVNPGVDDGPWKGGFGDESIAAAMIENGRIKRDLPEELKFRNAA